MIFCTKLHLGEAKKCSKRIFEKNSKMATFGAKIANFGHFWPKNEVFGHFFRNRTSELFKTWSETGDSCFIYLLTARFFFTFFPELGGWKAVYVEDESFDARDYGLTPDLDVVEYASGPR